MSRNSKSRSAVDQERKQRIENFSSITRTTKEVARLYIDKYQNLDVAVDNYYTNPNEFAQSSSKSTEQDRNTRLSALYNKYKTEDPDEENIALNGTIKLCTDLGVDPQDVVLLALAYELNSSEMCVWEKQGWMEGWRNLGCDSVESMKAALAQLSHRLAVDAVYFNAVYAKTFSFGLAAAQRHLALDMALGFWSILLPHALHGGALAHEVGDDMDEDGNGSCGWTDEHTALWLEFLQEKGLKGVTRDVWSQLPVFIRSIDSKFENYNEDDSWPTVIDEFVERVRSNKRS